MQGRRYSFVTEVFLTSFGARSASSPSLYTIFSAAASRYVTYAYVLFIPSLRQRRPSTSARIAEAAYTGTQQLDSPGRSRRHCSSGSEAVSERGHDPCPCCSFLARCGGTRCWAMARVMIVLWSNCADVPGIGDERGNAMPRCAWRSRRACGSELTNCRPAKRLAGLQFVSSFRELQTG
jgi:hypothetical protein